jgi:hypothetical protein
MVDSGLMSFQGCGNMSDACLHPLQGYVRSRVGSFSFWVRLPAAAGSSTRPRPGSGDGAASAEQRLGGEVGSGGSARPLVFLHGVGLGLVRPFCATYQFCISSNTFLDSRPEPNSKCPF